MTLARLTVHALGIPFVESFKHSSQTRAFSDAVVVALTDADGVTGYGEGLPRPYVTGESVEGMLAYLTEAVWPRLAGQAVPPLGTPDELEALASWLPEPPAPGLVAPHAARSALELALIDLALKRAGRPMSAVLPPRRAQVTYSGVITAGPVEKAAQHARQMKLIGLSDIKIKVGEGDDVARVAAVREVFGPGAALRLDANGAWDLAGALAALEALAPYEIACVEQPMPRGPLEPWSRLCAASPIPVMVDESLVTPADAEALIAARATHWFNVRVSKCGGLVRALAMARRALDAGLSLQIGSQVGETAILSAAGRHLACALPEARFVEGSFGTLLLTEDLAVMPVKFGHRGLAPALTGAGLGVSIVEARLAKYARRTLVCEGARVSAG